MTRRHLDPIPLNPARAASLGEPLLAWFAIHKRPMPWRETKDPYRIWISEVMLQQTQVATVIPYFERFVARFPTVGSLAAASPDELLKHWEGLGYYSRARNLQAAAKVLVEHHEGTLPRELGALMGLPGVGSYTAGAIASIAFNQPVPAVDGNVFRLLSRVFTLSDDITRPATRLRFEDLAQRLIPSGSASTFNQALMELGATVCSPTRPDCAACPWQDGCAARAADRIGEYPVKAKKAAPKEVDFAVLVARSSDGRYLIGRRPDGGLLGGLWEFPTRELAPGETVESGVVGLAEALGLTSEPPVPLVTVPHLFTHRKARFIAYLADGAAGPDGADLRWVSEAELDEYAWPLAQAKIRGAIAQPAQLALELTPRLPGA